MNDRFFDINLKKLAILLLPTFLRKPLIVAFLQVAMDGLSDVYTAFKTNRNANSYRLKHNGQVCYLRAVLNDAFPDRSRDFVIGKSDTVSGLVYARDEQIFPYDQLQIPSEPDSILLWSEEYILSETTPFMVGCPPEIFANTDAMERVKFLVNQYKLLSKRPKYYLL